MRSAILICCGLLLACQPRGPITAADFGAEIFQDARLSESNFNSFSCATCHSTSAEPDATRIDSGYSLRNVASRPSWWGGYEVDLLGAVNFCFVYFMRGVPELSEDDPKSKALYEYLMSISPAANTPTLPFTVVRNVTNIAKGNTARGEEVYRAACRVCHGEARSGSGRINDETPILPGVTEDYASRFPMVPPELVVVEKVRHGQFFHIGGNMPLYSKEALSDEDLGALLAFFGL